MAPYLAESYSLPLKTRHKLTPGVFHEPLSPIPNVLSQIQTPEEVYLACFHHRIAGELSKSHYLGSLGGIGRRLSCHDSLGVFSRLNLHYSVRNSSLQPCSVLIEGGQQTVPNHQNRSLEKVAALNQLR